MSRAVISTSITSKNSIACVSLCVYRVDFLIIEFISFSISPNGHFLTNDPLFDREKIEAPKFKKDTGKKVKKKKETNEDNETPDWAKNVKKIDVTKYQTSDPNFYENTVNEVFDWCATEKIEPYISQTSNLEDVNKALNFMTAKKCLGKVLINTERNRL